MLNYFLSNKIIIGVLILEHSVMVVLSVAIAFLIGLPIGILLARRKIFGEVAIYFSSIIFCIPSIALFGFFMPLLAYFGYGVGSVPTVLAVILYSLAPIIRNTYSGILSIPTDVQEASRAMGMNSWQRLMRVELPICIPNVIAGMKIAIILATATVTLGAYIGASGLGQLIIRGISQSDYVQIGLGSILVTCLAWGLDCLIIIIERMSKKLIFFIRSIKFTEEYRGRRTHAQFKKCSENIS